MELTGVPVPTMDWDSINLLESFKKFRKHAEVIFKGVLSEKSEEVQVTYMYLLLWLGEKGREIFDTLGLSDDQKKKVKDICNAFEQHVQPQSNPVFSRYKFNMEIQGDNTFEQFLTRVKVLASDCAFEDTYRDDMIRDRIVFGVKSTKIREKLLTEGSKLTLVKALQLYQSYDYAQQQLKCMQTNADADVNAVKHTPRSKPDRTRTGAKPEVTGSKPQRQDRRRVQRMLQPHKPRGTCQNCGRSHGKGQCPAKGKQCNFCKKLNNFAVACKSRDVNDIRRDNCSNSDCETDVFVDSVNSKVTNGQVFAEFQVGKSKQPVKFKVDTGAQVNVKYLILFFKIWA